MQGNLGDRPSPRSWRLWPQPPHSGNLASGRSWCAGTWKTTNCTDIERSKALGVAWPNCGGGCRAFPRRRSREQGIQSSSPQGHVGNSKHKPRSGLHAPFAHTAANGRLAVLHRVPSGPSDVGPEHAPSVDDANGLGARRRQATLTRLERQHRVRKAEALASQAHPGAGDESPQEPVAFSPNRLCFVELRAPAYIAFSSGSLITLICFQCFRSSGPSFCHARRMAVRTSGFAPPRS